MKIIDIPPPPAPCRIPVSSSAIAPSSTSLAFSVIVFDGERLCRSVAERRLFRSECPGFVRLRLFVGLDEASGIRDAAVSALSVAHHYGHVAVGDHWVVVVCHIVLDHQLVSWVWFRLSHLGCSYYQ